jgi:hypothetical protein
VCVTSTALLLTTPHRRGGVVTSIAADRIAETRLHAPGAIEVAYRSGESATVETILLDFRYFGDDDGSAARIRELAASR